MSVGNYFNLTGRAGRYPALDGLRGIAIAAVLLRHAVHEWPEQLQGAFWNGWYNGWLGVDLFFALSGFLILHHLMNWWPSKNTGQFIKTYFYKRALRIVPIYATAILIGIAGIIPYYKTPQPVTHEVVVWHFLFIQEYFQSTIAVPLWSVSVEEKFYLLAPFIAFGSLKIGGSKALQLLGIFLLLFLIVKLLLLTLLAPVDYAQYFWEFRAPFHFSAVNILPGSMVAIFLYSHRQPLLSQQSLRRLSAICFSTLALVFLTIRWLDAKSWVAVDLAAITCSISYGILIYCATHSGLVGSSLLESRALRFLAKISYPLYAIHIMLIPMAINLTSKLNMTSEPSNFLAFFGLYATLSVLTASVIHLVIEKPFLNIKDGIHYRANQTLSPA